MKLLLSQLIPKSLVERVFSLYLASLISFVALGLGLFYNYQFSQEIDSQVAAADVMMNVAAQTVADSAVLGDYDTITKTLERTIAGSEFAKAQFIDTKGGVLKATRSSKVVLAAPQWFERMVQAKLDDVNQNVAVGGKDYGVIRLSFASDEVAGRLWDLGLIVLGLGLVSLLLGGAIIRIPLRRWLGNFDRVRTHEREILSGGIDIEALLDKDAPLEIRHTFDILKRAAGRLDAQREEASVTLNAITDGVVTTDERHNIIYVNPAAEIMLASSARLLIGKDIRTLMPSAFPSGKDDIGWMMKRVELPGPNGKPMILDTTRSALNSSGHNLVGQVVAMRDVSQQHALDQQLRSELEARQRALESLQQILNTFQATGSPQQGLENNDLDALIGNVVSLVNEREMGHRALDNQKFALDQHAIVSITDLNGNITYANDRFCEVSGYSRAELLGVNHRIIKSGRHSDAFFAALWQNLTEGRVWHGEVCNRHKSGTEYWVDATIVPLLGKDGLPEQYIGIRTNITARKAVEAQLAEQLNFVEILLEATPTAIYLKDRSGRYIRFNRAFEDLFGIVRSRWFGKTVFDLVPGESAAMMHQKDMDLFERGEVQTYEATFTNHKTGAMREGLYWKAPLTNDRGEITGLVGTIMDVTENNRVNAELREAKTQAEVANKAKSDFLANMSHEIRTPMNGVIGMTDLALDTALNDAQREYLNVVKSSAQALMVILNDILDFSKIEAGKLQIENIDFSPSVVIEDTLKAVVARAEKKGLTISTQMDSDLPKSMRGDPGRIRQVLTNLCDNAIKFTANGSISIEARSAHLADSQHDELHLCVRDTGIGIPASKLGAIFAAFTQADTSTTRQYGGTGLGLTICARLVELMGGKIWVESEFGHGSAFHFTVRLQSVNVQTASSNTGNAIQTPNANPTAAETISRHLNILLVEDNLVNQKLATLLLQKWGHVCTLAQNGQEAVDLFPSQQWDLILMDMQMPVMGGLEATRLIRGHESNERRTPILAMTANAMAADRQACLDAGMDDHLSKPLNAKSLQACIERLVN